MDPRNTYMLRLNSDSEAFSRQSPSVINTSTLVRKREVEPENDRQEEEEHCTRNWGRSMEARKKSTARDWTAASRQAQRQLRSPSPHGTHGYSFLLLTVSAFPLFLLILFLCSICTQNTASFHCIMFNFTRSFEATRILVSQLYFLRVRTRLDWRHRKCD